MIKLKWDKVEIKFHNKLGEIQIFRIITVLSVYFTCFPPLKIWLTHESDLYQWQNEITEVELG